MAPPYPLDMARHSMTWLLRIPVTVLLLDPFLFSSVPSFLFLTAFPSLRALRGQRAWITVGVPVHWFGYYMTLGYYMLGFMLGAGFGLRFTLGSLRFWARVRIRVRYSLDDRYCLYLATRPYPSHPLEPHIQQTTILLEPPTKTLRNPIIVVILDEPLPLTRPLGWVGLGLG